MSKLANPPPAPTPTPAPQKKTRTTRKLTNFLLFTATLLSLTTLYACFHPTSPHKHATIEGTIGVDHHFSKFRYYLSKGRGRFDLVNASRGMSLFVVDGTTTLIYNRTHTKDGLNGLVCYQWKSYEDTNLLPGLSSKPSCQYMATEYRDSYLSYRFNVNGTALRDSLFHMIGGHRLAQSNTNITESTLWLETGTLRPVAAVVAGQSEDYNHKYSWETVYEVEHFEDSVPAFIYEVPKTVLPYCQWIDEKKSGVAIKAALM